jgi:putative membrane protein
MSRRFWHASPTGLLILAIMAGACRSRADTENANQGAASSETGAVGSPQAADTGSAGELTDANIVALLDEANKADSSAGAVAVKKASSAEVKRFAREMMADHHALRLAGEQAAKKANITPSAPANDPVAPLVKTETSVLDSTAAGPAFDRAYIEQEVTAHRAVKDLLDKAGGEADNSDLKAAIEKASPIVERHLSEAESLQKKLAGKA